MRCEQCGAEVAKGESFCRVCGARVKAAEPERGPEEQAAPEAPERELDKPKKQNKQKPAEGRERRRLLIVAIAGIVIAAVAVVLTIVLANVGKSPMMETDDDRPFFVSWDNAGGEGSTGVLYSADCTALAADVNYKWVYEESVWNGTSAFIDNHGRLTVATAKETLDVSDSAYTALVSADGSRVAYLKNYADEVGDLYVYDVKKQQSSLIDTQVSEYGIALSPSGETVCYTAYDSPSDAYHARMSRGLKKGERILDCEWVLGVTDDAKLLYFVNGGRFYAMKDGERTRLYDGSDLYYPMSMNADCTQLLFSCGDGCFIVRDGTPEKIAPATYADAPIVLGDWQPDGCAATRFKTFVGAVVNMSGELYRIDESGVTPISGCTDAVVSENGEKLVYIDISGNVMQIKNIRESLEAEVLARPDETPTALYGCGKLSDVYFENARGELWCISGGKTNMVSADVSDLRVGGDGRLYFVYDGVVLCCAQGSERVSVERREGIVSVNAAPRGVTVETTRDGTFYYKDGGDAVKLPVSVAQAKEEK